jgi:hypothetical protein
MNYCMNGSVQWLLVKRLVGDGDGEDDGDGGGDGCKGEVTMETREDCEVVNSLTTMWEKATLIYLRCVSRVIAITQVPE